MKLKIIARDLAVGPWLAVEDENGNRLPNVRAINLKQNIRETAILTLEIVVDGDTVSLVLQKP
jgi:hypothetical protein